MENSVFDRRLSAEPSDAECISQESFTFSQLEVPEACTVADVLKKLGVPSQWKKLLIVNGRHRTPDSILHPGDTLVFFPPLEGG